MGAAWRDENINPRGLLNRMSDQEKSEAACGAAERPSTSEASCGAAERPSTRHNHAKYNNERSLRLQ